MSNHTAKENTGSHAFFFTILFMTSVVILTIVGYFLFLPKTAPKLIIVAVLPFDAPEGFPESLTRGLPRHLTEILAESRDMYVVDYDAAEEAAALKEKSRGFRNELGTTHIVDGSYEVNDAAPNSWILTIRLIDVGKDVWKLKWSDEFQHPKLSVLDIRNTLATEVAAALYDNSIPERDYASLNADGFSQYLEASVLFHNGDREAAITLLQEQNETTQNAYGALLLSQLLPSSQKQYVEKALVLKPDYYPAMIVHSKLQYHNTANLVYYFRDTLTLARQYPNSDAVERLALFYSELGWFEEARDVLLRWAQIRPRSSAPALAIGFNRFRLNNLKGVEESLEIARLRDPADTSVKRYQALYEWKVIGKALDPGDSEFLHWIAQIENNHPVQDNGDWLSYIETLACDDQIELSLYVNNIDYIFDNYECADRKLWLQPPPWWSESDPNWIAFRGDPRYVEWQNDAGIRTDVLAGFEPIAAHDLFAPERNLMPPKQEN